jgi:hypothetical protein
MTYINSNNGYIAISDALVRGWYKYSTPAKEVNLIHESELINSLDWVKQV